MKRKILSIFTAVALTTFTLISDISVNAAEQYGFSYDADACSAQFKTGGVVTTYDAGGEAIGKMWYTVGRIRNKNKNSNGTYQDALVVRMQMDPQKGVQTKYNGIAYGVSEYLKVTANLPSNSINDWSPKNEPKETTWNINLSLGANAAGKNNSISASTIFTEKQLDFEADIQISNQKATFIYDYKPEKSFSWSSTVNKYVRNSSMQYAMVSFNAKNYSNIVLTFNSNFTMADDKDAKPIFTDFGSKKGVGSYVFSFK